MLLLTAVTRFLATHLHIYCLRCVIPSFPVSPVLCFGTTHTSSPSLEPDRDSHQGYPKTKLGF